MHEPLDITTIIFALLAVFVVWKLRSVLGTRTGNEKQRDRTFSPRPEEARQPLPGGNVIRLPGAPVADAGPAAPPQPAADRWKDIVEPDSRAIPGLDAIAAAEPSFDARAFLAGGKSAYEMIVIAFAKGDRGTFVSLEKVAIDDAQVKGSAAQITVRFLSKLITATYDKAGAVIDGSPERVVDMTDIWTFARELGSRDPNWRLVATETAH
jgi:predicted lipid-binding transport protein (Tim44 family)